MGHVIIVGAGPAGVATAFLLAQRGIQVSLLEQETQFDRVFRGEGLMPSGVAALQEMGLADCLADIPQRRLDAWDFCIEQRRRMRVVEPQGAPGQIPTHLIHQSALLKAIVERSQTLPHFQFYPGWQMQSLVLSGDRIQGVNARCGDERRAFTGDLVIAADGRYSRLRKLAGLALNQAATQFDVLWFKLPAPAELLCETVFTVCLQRQRQFAFYPSWDGRLQIGWIVAKGQAKTMGDRDWAEEFAQASPKSLASYFRQQRHQLEGPIFLDVIVGQAPQWFTEGLLLIGDAAHPMAPNRAQGINMALRDAIVVCNQLRALGTSSVWSHEQLQDALQAIQTSRQPEITAAQHRQLEEWQKIAFFTASPLIYRPFVTLATLLGRLGLVEQAWLWQQRGLRQGITSVTLEG